MKDFNITIDNVSANTDMIEEDDEVASELSCRNYYSTVSYGFIVEAVKDAKKDLELSVIYDSDIDVIDAYIRENLI